MNKKVGKHNSLSGDTAPGRTGSSIDGEYSIPTLRLAMWPGPPCRWVNTSPNHQNIELQEQVDELQNDVIACLQSESEKQKEWLASHSNERNTHLAGAVEK